MVLGVVLTAYACVARFRRGPSKGHAIQYPLLTSGLRLPFCMGRAFDNNDPMNLGLIVHKRIKLCVLLSSKCVLEGLMFLFFFFFFLGVGWGGGRGAVKPESQEKNTEL